MSSERFQLRGDPAAHAETMREALYAQGVPTAASFANSWSGIGGGSYYGLTFKVDVMFRPGGEGGAYFELRINPEFESSSIIMAIVLYLFCLPAGIIVGLLAWQAYTNRQRELFVAAWGAVSEAMVQSTWAGPPGHPG